MALVALLSDIHANIHALRAVLDEVETLKIDRIVFCGDIVGYGPHPAECVKLVREFGGACVMGNHDFYTLAAHKDPELIPPEPETFRNPVLAGIHHAAKHLDQDAIDWLGSLPLALEIPGAIVAHSALHDFEQWPYLLDLWDALPTLKILVQSRFQIGFFGHTHRQAWFSQPCDLENEPFTHDRFHLRDDTVYAVVVGSVGQPRTGDPRAAWTLWDSDARKFEFRRTPYPVARTVSEIQEAGLPASSARRLLSGH